MNQPLSYPIPSSGIPPRVKNFATHRDLIGDRAEDLIGALYKADPLADEVIVLNSCRASLAWLVGSFRGHDRWFAR